ncbi:MAG: magnesium transporter CorA family protein [Oscillospiraceae bacterium]
MVKYYISAGDGLREAEELCSDCWVSMTAPTEEEVRHVAQGLAIDADAIRSALDTDERSRIETDDDYMMVLVNIPSLEEQDEMELYTTIPLSVITTKNAIVTVCLEDTPALRPFSSGRQKEFRSGMKSRFILQILYQVAALYLQYLHTIDKKTELVENKLHKSTQNSELIELLRLEKSLVYFTTALRSNEAVLEKLLRTGTMKRYPEDAELLEDVIVENKQAIEMANIYSGILSGMMDAFASVISNNLNIVMKVLAVVTIVMSIPTMIFSAYGMNVALTGMPLSGSPYGFIAIVGISLLISLIATMVFVKLKMFK